MKKLFKKRRTYKRLNKKHFDKEFTERKMFFEDVEEIKENYKQIINNEKDYNYELIRLNLKIEGFSYFDSIYAQLCITTITVLMTLWITKFVTKFDSLIDFVVFTFSLIITLNFIRYPINSNKKTRYFMLCVKVLEQYKGEILYCSSIDEKESNRARHQS